MDGVEVRSGPEDGHWRGRCMAAGDHNVSSIPGCTSPHRQIDAGTTRIRRLVDSRVSRSAGSARQAFAAPILSHFDREVAARSHTDHSGSEADGNTRQNRHGEVEMGQESEPGSHGPKNIESVVIAVNAEWSSSIFSQRGWWRRPQNQRHTVWESANQRECVSRRAEMSMRPCDPFVTPRESSCGRS